MPRPAPRFFSAAIFVSLTFFLQAQAHAIFDFSVAPRRGGQDLSIRFDEGIRGEEGFLRNEEVRVAINTTENVPYRITETVNQIPTDTGTGKTLPLNSFIQFSPSNPIGRLEARLETPVAPGVNQIYTNESGESDEFILVFNVRLPEDQPGGLYRTQITFTAEPLTPGSSFSSRTVIMNVSIEIPQTFRMATRTARGGRELDLGRIRRDGDAASAVYKIDVDSNIGTEYRIVQQLTEPLSSPEGEPLDAAAFTWTVVARAGEGSGAPRPVSESPETIYRSDSRGQADALEIQYALTPREGQKAGVYRGTLLFKAESDSPLVRREPVSVPVQVEVEPILYLDIETQSGAAGLSFGRFRSQDEAKEVRVDLKVHTNLGQEYAVSQILPHSLAAQGGHTIGSESLQYYGSEAESGLLTDQAPVPVREGETIVYRSDSKGSAESFSLNYRLSIPKDTPAGSYNSELKYSITTL